MVIKNQSPFVYVSFCDDVIGWPSSRPIDKFAKAPARGRQTTQRARGKLNRPKARPKRKNTNFAQFEREFFPFFRDLEKAQNTNRDKRNNTAEIDFVRIRWLDGDFDVGLYMTSYEGFPGKKLFQEFDHDRKILKLVFRKCSTLKTSIVYVRVTQFLTKPLNSKNSWIIF